MQEHRGEIVLQSLEQSKGLDDILGGMPYSLRTITCGTLPGSSHFVAFSTDSYYKKMPLQNPYITPYSSLAMFFPMIPM